MNCLFWAFGRGTRLRWGGLFQARDEVSGDDGDFFLMKELRSSYTAVMTNFLFHFHLLRTV